MAASSLFALIDDIATLLDDVALLSKAAAKQTTGVLGDDLALNAQQVSGVAAERELPVVWAVAKGSARNKAILVPGALAISAWAPWAVTPLLMVGGTYLCFEGFEKIAHKFLHSAAEDAGDQQALRAAAQASEQDLLNFERAKIKGAIRTDFVLSAEIIAITLGTVAAASFPKQVLVLSGIAVVMTIGVYGLVAAIVKMDDVGLYMSRSKKTLVRGLGLGLVSMAPGLMRTLTVVGTIAMFLVGGGILSHGLPALHGLAPALAVQMGPAGLLAGLLIDGLVGLAAGAVAVAAFTLGQRLWQLGRAQS
jgi:predicted DNA repair protein MutK